MKWKDIEERFRSKVRKGRRNECWEWQAARDPHGYGYYWHTRLKKMVIAPRYAYTRMVGPIPVGMHVLHRCDHPPCVNPAHLFLGTQTDNVRDCLEKGRVRAGEEHGMAKLQQNQVEMIRRIYEEVPVSQAYLGQLYGVTQQTIHVIVCRKRWPHAA